MKLTLGILGSAIFQFLLLTAFIETSLDDNVTALYSMGSCSSFGAYLLEITVSQS